MPKVPEYNLKPLKPIYNPRNPYKPVSYKQKNLIITMCEQRGIKVPNLNRRLSLDNKIKGSIIRGRLSK